MCLFDFLVVCGYVRYEVQKRYGHLHNLNMDRRCGAYCGWCMVGLQGSTLFLPLLRVSLPSLLMGSCKWRASRGLVGGVGSSSLYVSPFVPISQCGKCRADSQSHMQEGLVTCLFAILAYFIMVDFPDQLLQRRNAFLTATEGDQGPY
jgi:bacterioferritin-associated ferredoxin